MASDFLGDIGSGGGLSSEPTLAYGKLDSME